MNLPSSVLLGLFASVLLASTSPVNAAGKAEAEAWKLDETTAQHIRGFLDDISTQLTGAVKSDLAARKAILEHAMMPRFFGNELDAFRAEAAKIGEVESVRLTGFEVQATLWFGLLPLEDIELFFWVGKKDLKLLRMQRKRRNVVAFGRRPSPGWAGPVPEAFGALADQILRAAVDGRCETLPLVGPEDYREVLPRDRKAAKRTRDHLDRVRAGVAGTCKKIVGTPYHRVTWRLGDGGGLVTTRKKDKMTFRFEFVAGPKRDVRIYRLGKPTLPAKAN